MHTTTSVLLPVGAAAKILKVNRWQLDKLIGCGLAAAPEVTAGGQRRVESAPVLELAARQFIDPPGPGPGRDLAVHLGPLREDENGLANQRTHLGWHATANGLSRKQIEDAWAGLWPCHPEPYIGGALVGDVAGFVVVSGAITGFRRINGKVRFDLAPATPDITARYAGKRFVPVQGGLVQPLGQAR
jgi:hypothetical protein